MGGIKFFWGKFSGISWIPQKWDKLFFHKIKKKTTNFARVLTAIHTL